MTESFDVLIVGAGLSGIGMAAKLATLCPGKTYAVLERRAAIGGTWDLFRYPGIRSDSDMYTFGYSFRPWHDTRVLADGASIKQYIGDTAREYGVEKHIRFGVKVTSANWDGDSKRWTLSATDEASGKARSFTARFVVMCSGYYNYDGGFLPDFPGMANYRGQRIHPQQWPDDLDYKGKRVVVIGSGATAMTLVPAMADDTAHITLLQRSPTYIFSVPAVDKISQTLGRFLPKTWVYELARKRNIGLQRLLYTVARRRPEFAKKLLLGGVAKQLDEKTDMSHFTPRYNPWEERLCAVPNGDLFKTLRRGKASIVTDHIERFTPTGLQLKSGKTLDADIIVTATGLNVQLLGGMTLTVDGAPVSMSQRMAYKAVLAEGIPNFGFILGYTNASWTLKADIAADYLCRLINHLDASGKQVATPIGEESARTDDSVMGDLKSGYVQRANAVLPRQGKKDPWRVLNHYKRDKALLTKGPIDDPALQLS